MEEICREGLYELGLSYARRSCKDKGNRLALIGYTCAVALDSSRHSHYSLVLTDYLFLKAIRKLIYLLKFILADISSGDTRPYLDDLGNIRLGKHDTIAGGLKLTKLLRELYLLRLYACDLLVALLSFLFIRRGICLKCFSLILEHHQLFAYLLRFVENRA